jgi:hypothetical protein
LKVIFCFSEYCFNIGIYDKGSNLGDPPVAGKLASSTQPKPSTKAKQ